MKKYFAPRRILVATSLSLALIGMAACQSSEEKAEKHYLSGMELLRAGDIDRALVEFRNVFQRNGRHQAARREYARIQRERGNLREAYGQYLRLVEQYPEDVIANLALAEIAMGNGSWDIVNTHARRALAAAPGDDLAKSLVLIVDYRAAMQAAEQGRQDEILAQAEALLQKNPGLGTLRRFVIEEHLRRRNGEAALALIEAGLVLSPGDADLQALRLSALYALGRAEEITSQLEAALKRSPADARSRDLLVSWHMQQRRPEAAEAVLRGQINPADDALDPRMRLISFLAQVRGISVASAEIEQLVAARPDSANVAVLRAMQAGYDFDAGKRSEAVAMLEGIVSRYPDSPQINAIRVILARLLSMTGNDVGARALVEKVLAEDAGHADAQKLKIGWLIEDDRTEDAQVALRALLSLNPNDAGALTLMARAYEREGSRDLMGEALSQAVVASKQAPAESLRYASFLIAQDKLLPAEDVLVMALRRQPANGQILAALSSLYIRMKDWARAEHALRTLEEIEANGISPLAAAAPGAEVRSSILRAQLLAARDQQQDLRKYLEQVAQSEGALGAEAEMALVRDALRRNEYDDALSRVARLREQHPDVAPIRLLQALVLSESGETQQSKSALEELTRSVPDFERGWIALYRLELSSGDIAASERVLLEAEARLPKSVMLKWLRAGLLENRGDVDAAIAIYEDVYAENSNHLFIANNLASLLSTEREDGESLERAYMIARRLRNSSDPAFQDTYGWIAYRRGNLTDAIPHLEAAAKGLPEDHRVQFHLAVVYRGLNRKDEAFAILNKIESADPPATARLLKLVRDEIARLQPEAGSAGN
jgi:predicted Zn-dependent protease